jgi:hypothetical protein
VCAACSILNMVHSSSMAHAEYVEVDMCIYNMIKQNYVLIHSHVRSLYEDYTHILSK